jgi:hypothetical protein
MNAGRILLGFKAASNKTKLIGLGLVLVALAGAVAACSAAGEETGTSYDSLDQPKTNMGYAKAIRNYIQ